MDKLAFVSVGFSSTSSFLSRDFSRSCKVDEYVCSHDVVVGRSNSRVLVKMQAEDVVASGSGQSQELQFAKKQLLEAIESVRKEQNYKPRLAKAPATLVGLEEEVKQRLENDLMEKTRNLEKLTPYKYPLTSNPMILDGKWRLLYSDAREITSLAKLKLGFELNEVQQNITVSTKSFENYARVSLKRSGIAFAVLVSAKFAAGASGKSFGFPRSKNKSFIRAVQEKNRGSLINVEFQKRKLSLARFFLPLGPGLPLFSKMVMNPRGDPPALYITYVDEDLRIGRGKKGGTFILTRV
mmetsp:Transcript_13848/g.24828  ORF Transcript_13848/g.24828 Transcript_13848/m.24828 type:complete len:296 (+) Transcript_13848:70-957(+)